ncbi:Cyanobacterial phytochrome B [Lachnellula occidentalis]|uniref:Cyanobacterial phytochrome B n=1 Tax=Lachnellula occidentalis TaxID=215460 RepID=A0A8H8RN62_9HELO|nr:Cyanobacterial phytochrome B [Lachnellula occidentalis]
MSHKPGGEDARKNRDASLRVEIPPVPKELSGASNTSNLPTSSRKSQTASSNVKSPGLSKSNLHDESIHALDRNSSWSASSAQQLASPGSPTDRVFPIKSVVRVDTSQTPQNLPSRRSGEGRDYFPPAQGSAGNSRRQSQYVPSEPGKTPTPGARPQDNRLPNDTLSDDRKQSTSRTHSGQQVQLFSYAASDNSDSVSQRAPASSIGTRTSADRESISDLITARFKHTVTDEGHAVITGRDGEKLQHCEDEPIHMPGAIQSFGLLLTLEEQEGGDLLVRSVSENSRRIIGYSPDELFKLKSFTDIFSEEQSDNLLDHVDFLRDEEVDPASHGPEVFIISIRPPKSSRKGRKLWCAMHINPAAPNLLICEFEIDDDQLYPLVPQNHESPEPPEDTLRSKPTPEEYAESTMNTSKPLRVLRSARKRKGEAAAMEVFNIMSQVQEQLSSAPDLETFLKILVGVIKELTGFHRVMIYQFDADFNGRVVTELVDPRATTDLYKGLNFPASDIPKQARDLYKINKVRLLYDRDLETARMVCRTIEDLEQPLDLTFSYLRAMSPIHIKYLRNMGVRSSMSISINAFSELWGLIACHTYGSKGMRVSFPIRKMCRLVGDIASRNIERLSYAQRLQARKLINTVPTEANPSGYIVASSEDLLKLFDADFGLLSIRGETKIMGKMEHSQEALAMLEYLRLRRFTSVTTTQDIRQDFPDLQYPPGFDVIAGLLLVPLSAAGSDFIVFLRKGQVKEVKWAGNPYEKAIKEGTEGFLEPRTSFMSWSETVVGKCREWTEEQVETAAVLCLVYGKFIEVWRQKEAALQSSQLTRLLLANSAHEVRTPLNAIINYLEIALEGTLDQETRDNLAKSHSASKSLVYVINDLLDLTKTEEGQELIKDEAFDLHATIHEAVDSFRGEAKRKGLEYEVIDHPGVPQFVIGEQRRVRQVVANITANAIQHTTNGSVRIEVCPRGVADGRATVEIVVQDSGAGMSNEKLDALFRDLEQVSSDADRYFDDSDDGGNTSQVKDSRILGLGLAVVARVVRNMDGQLRLKSEQGKGSRFVIQLPFVLPDDESGDDDAISRSAKLAKQNSNLAPSIAAEGEITLVDKVSSSKAEGVVDKRSIEDFASLHSFKSGSSAKSRGSAKSDVDRLINAISGPFTSNDQEAGEQGLCRSESKGSGHSRKSAGSLGTTTSSAPGKLSRTKSRTRSHGAPDHRRSHLEGPAGTEFVTDTGTLMKAVKMPDEFDSPGGSPAHSTSRVLFRVPNRQTEQLPERPKKLDAEHLQVLYAEDDPVNSKIMRKRMEKSGHAVQITVNGEECAAVYGDKPAFFDVVLMDMQMPIVDGLTSTRMIRSFEKAHSQSILSPRAANNGRVPIFAVSASLLERERQHYIDAGFDGWILKPVDFKRLNILLQGIVDDEIRNSCLYQPGAWEIGGWFQKRQPNVVASPEPTEHSPVRHSSERPSSLQNEGSMHSSNSGSTIVARKSVDKRPLIYDERLDGTADEMEVDHSDSPEAQAQT